MTRGLQSYIKPDQMLDIHRDIVQMMQDSETVVSHLTDSTQLLLRTCPVCGGVGCSKVIKKANGVYVHPEDVQAADKIERPY